MSPFDLSEVQALPIPRCGPEDLAGLPEDYLALFVAPRLRRAGDGVTCIGCGGDLWVPGIVGFLCGATFTWGLANGEGHCSGCGYPTRMYHRPPELEGKTGTFPLQYHPDDLERRTR